MDEYHVNLKIHSDTENGRLEIVDDDIIIYEGELKDFDRDEKDVAKLIYYLYQAKRLLEDLSDDESTECIREILEKYAKILTGLEHEE